MMFFSENWNERNVLKKQYFNIEVFILLNVIMIYGG